MTTYTIGLDYGTNSVRGLLVDTANGVAAAASIYEYRYGDCGVIGDPQDPLLARQDPRDYVDGTRFVLQDLVVQARTKSGVAPEKIVGIGVDTTGSTPIPVDADGTALALRPEFIGNVHAMPVLWKDHTGHAEALEITELAAKVRPQYLAKCGGTYSAEWFWAKILHNIRVHPEIAEHIASWVEHADWMPAVLCGTIALDVIRRGICAAGHKGMYGSGWGGYPDADFLAMLDEGLDIRASLPSETFHVGERAGGLSVGWAETVGLPDGIPVSIGAIDAHLGAIGAGITPGALVKIVGTSTCDIMIAPLDRPLPDIEGLCGIVPESVLPGYYGLEAGQSAVGDIFNWFVSSIRPANMSHAELTQGAQRLRPGESGLLALDWHNGNRTVLVDQLLTGSVTGLTLATTPAELYRAWIEATAFGARVIIERLEESGQSVARIIICGGIAAKNPLVMQVYADVLGRPIQISSSEHTCALGSAIAAAVAANIYTSFGEATAAMTSISESTFVPNKHDKQTYDLLYRLYKQMHDAFGVKDNRDGVYNVMKDLIRIREDVRGSLAR